VATPSEPVGSSGLQLNRQAFHDLKNGFLTRVDDFSTFAEQGGRQWVQERAYKDELFQLIRLELPEELFQPGVASAAEIVSRADRVLRKPLRWADRKPQNLVGWRYLALFAASDSSEKETLATALGTLLYGPGTNSTRVGQFSRLTWDVFKRTIGGHPYAATRIVPTLFLTALNPAANIPVRTDMFERSARLLLGRRIFEDQPFSTGEYESVLRFAISIEAALAHAGWLPADMIDVHSFLWVSTATSYT
jgi:hypothetical protein